MQSWIRLTWNVKPLKPGYVTSEAFPAERLHGICTREMWRWNRERKRTTPQGLGW